MEHGDGKSRILLHTVPARSDLSKAIDWNDKYLSKESFVLALGESFTGPVTIDLTNIPHVLLGGSTGSGKSVLLKLFLMQSVRKGAEVIIADFKSGVDFPSPWHKSCRMCFDEINLAQILTELVDEMQHRKQILQASECRNIDENNKTAVTPMKRHIFACDEIAEVLDKTGLTKVPVHLKVTLTIQEAAGYSNIGINKIASMLRAPNCPFVLYIGTKKLVKRREFEQFLRRKWII